MSWPTGAPASSSKRPPWSSDSLSSRAEHNMPWLSTPRSLPTLMRNGLPSSPGGSSAPTRAHGTLMPTRALGAPHTILSSAPCPTSTWHTRSRSASGCCTASLISPTTILVNGGATGRSSSTSRPAMVSVSASSAVVKGGLQNSRNQDSGNCIVGHSCTEGARRRAGPARCVKSAGFTGTATGNGYRRQRTGADH